MATLMDRAIEQLRALPAESQDRFARFVLHELSSDADWQRTTDAHPDAVRRLVDEVLSADRDDMTLFSFDGHQSKQQAIRDDLPKPAHQVG